MISFNATVRVRVREDIPGRIPENQTRGIIQLLCSDISGELMNLSDEGNYLVLIIREYH